MNFPEILDTEDAPEDDDYAGVPYNEDGVDANGQNVFCPGPY